MDKFCICIAYNGKWTRDNQYLDHETKLILVNHEITFEGLVEKIFEVLKLKRVEIEANIWFDTKLETSKGMLVTNDEEVTTCIYLLKNDSKFKTSRLIVDIPKRKSLLGKRSKAKSRNSSVHEEVSVVPQEEEEGLLEFHTEKDEMMVGDDEALTEPTMEPEYSTPEEDSEETGQASNDMKVRRSARLAKIRKRSTIQSKKRKRSTRKRDDLPTVVLREDASLDEIVEGSVFTEKKVLKKCFLNNAREYHFRFKVIRSNRRRYYLKCFYENCSWCMYSSQVRDSALFKISKLEKKHSCSVDDVLSDPRKIITSTVISDYIIKLVHDTKVKVKPIFVVKEVRKRYGLDISYDKAWRATQQARGVIGIPEQRHEESSTLTCTNIERDDLPTVVLREDASLDEIAVGSIFEDKESLKKCFSKNAIKYHFNFKVNASNHKTYNLKCYDDECSWYLQSSKVRDSSLFRINKFEKTHSCSVDVSSDQKQLTYKVISDYIIELLHDTGEEITPNFVVEEMRRRYGLNVSYAKARRAVQLFFAVTRESPEEIPDPELCPSCLYLTEKEESNLETCADTKKDDQTQKIV